MDPQACNISGCTETPAFLLAHATRRRLLKQEAYCGKHIKDFLVNYYASQIVGKGLPRNWGDAVEFDFDLVLYDSSQNNKSMFCLREVGGRRLFVCEIGIFESWMLILELERFSTPRPLTYETMASIITTLGGRLDCVVIDKFIPAQRIFEAKLNISQMNNTKIVDVRPSDAVILGLVCEVPIFVSNIVLDTMPKMQR
jgi:bifunctional DNase/RNase